VILPYDPRDPDGDCGMARSRFPDVPETHEIAKVLGYCKALVARRKTHTAFIVHLEAGPADADEYERVTRQSWRSW
jgi:hypothetical protein